MMYAAIVGAICSVLFGFACLAGFYLRVAMLSTLSLPPTPLCTFVPSRGQPKLSRARSDGHSPRCSLHKYDNYHERAKAKGKQMKHVQHPIALWPRLILMGLGVAAAITNGSYVYMLAFVVNDKENDYWCVDSSSLCLRLAEGCLPGAQCAGPDKSWEDDHTDTTSDPSGRSTTFSQGTNKDKCDSSVTVILIYCLVRRCLSLSPVLTPAALCRSL